MKSIMFLSVLLGSVILLMSCTSTPLDRDNPATGLHYRTLAIRGVERRYAVYVPREYRATTPTIPTNPWPCIIFLNGSGECGEDGQRQLTQGLFPAMINAPTDYPFIAIFPQKPTRASSWADHDEYVMATFAATQKELAIDASRVYLTGLSQGGAGAWAIGARHPDIFAAIAPICGFGDPVHVAAGLRSMPIWAMHGERDDVVPIAQSEGIIQAIAKAGNREVQLNPPSGANLKPNTSSSLRFTRFPDHNHGCWDRAYRDMELGEWFLSFRKH